MTLKQGPIFIVPSCQSDGSPSAPRSSGVIVSSQPSTRFSRDVDSLSRNLTSISAFPQVRQSSSNNGKDEATWEMNVDVLSVTASVWLLSVYDLLRGQYQPQSLILASPRSTLPSHGLRRWTRLSSPFLLAISSTSGELYTMICGRSAPTTMLGAAGGRWSAIARLFEPFPQRQACQMVIWSYLHGS